MTKKKELLILFEGTHIAYSPTIAQLYQYLSPYFDITIFAADPKSFSDNLPSYKLETYSYPTSRYKGYFYKSLYEILLRISNRVKKLNKDIKGNYNIYFFRYLKIKKLIESNRFDKILSVDLHNLFFVNSILRKHSYFLSLELCVAEDILPLIDTSLIDAVVIQSEARFKYLFKEAPLRTFLVQNAPVFDPSVIKSKRSGLIYAGTAWRPFGFDFCLDFVLKYSTEKLTVLGKLNDDLLQTGKYDDLLKSGNLTIIDKYIPDEGVVESISSYEIGFCFYNFDIDWINTFNYISVPSGKMFKCLAAGIPMICNDILGFQFFDDFKCGVRIEKFDPDSIKAAIDTIRADYNSYVQGAIKAAEYFSFDKGVEPFVEYVTGKQINEAFATSVISK